MRRNIAPGPPPPAPSVLLIQPEWPARALLKTELEEEGWDVLGADTPGLAVDLATARGFRPDAVVVDTVGLSIDAVDLRGLQFARGCAPLLLLQSSQYDPPYAALSPTAMLPRPFTIGDVVNALRALITHPK